MVGRLVRVGLLVGGFSFFIATLLLVRVREARAQTGEPPSLSAERMLRLLPPSRTAAPGLPTFRSGRRIEVGDTPGSVFVIGGEVVQSGLTQGDFVAAGGSVQIRGTIAQDVYVAAGTTIISGVVDGNVIMAGGELQILPTGTVAGSVIAAGESVVHRGQIGGSVWTTGTRFALDGVVVGDVQVDVEEITLGESASLSGQLLGKAAQSVRGPGAARVRTHALQVAMDDPTPPKPWWRKWLEGFVRTSIAVGIITFLVHRFMPRALERVETLTLKQHLAAVLYGMASLALGPVLALFAFVTLVGAPAAGLALGVWVLILSAGSAWVVKLVSDRFASWERPLYRLGAAVFILAAGMSIPAWGGFITTFLAAWGAGLMLRTIQLHH